MSLAELDMLWKFVEYIRQKTVGKKFQFEKNVFQTFSDT